MALNESGCRGIEKEKLTGFSLAIDGGRLNATHFGKVLQCELLGKKQKEWAAALRGQTADSADVEVELVSGGERCRPGAGKGRGTGRMREGRKAF